MTEEFIVHSLVGDQISDLIKNGWNVNVYCKRDYSSSHLNNLSEMLKVYNVPFSRKINIINDINSLIILTYFLFNKKGLFVYSTPKASLLGSISSFILFKRKRIYFMRGRVFENYVGLKFLIFEFIERLISKLSDDIVFLTYYHRNLYIKNKLVSSKNAHIIHNGSSNGIDLNLFSKAFKNKTFLKNNMGYYKNDIIIIFAARISIDKGIKDFINVTNNLFNQFHNLRVIIVGRNEIEIDFKKEYCNNFSKVKIIGWTNEIEKYFSVSDILLLPSYREGFGNVYVQSSAAGCVPIGYNIPGVNSAVKNKFSGILVDFKNQNQLEESCKKLLLNKELLDRYINNGLSYSKLYDKNIHRKKLLKFYEERHGVIYSQ